MMARQYFGCPATSASVERLFSKVGVAFSAKRKSSEAETLANIMFANANVNANLPSAGDNAGWVLNV